MKARWYSKKDLFIIFLIFSAFCLSILLYPSRKIEIYFGDYKADIDNYNKTVIIRGSYGKTAKLSFKINPFFAGVHLKPIYFHKTQGIADPGKYIKLVNGGEYSLKDLGSRAEILIDYYVTKTKYDLYVITGSLPILKMSSDHKKRDIDMEDKIQFIINMEDASNKMMLHNANAYVRRRGRHGESKRKYNIWLDKAASLFGLPKRKRWSLYAEPYDLSCFREKFAFDLMNLAGGRGVAPESFFTDLFINGEYQGIYVLEQRYDGQLLGFDKYKKGGSDPSVIFRFNEQIRYDIFDKIRSSNDITGELAKITSQIEPDPEKKDLIGELWEFLEFCLYSGDKDFFDPKTGVSAKLDIGSFVDFFLHLQLTKNTDGIAQNTVISRESSDNGAKGLFVLHTWDHDKSFGWRLVRKVDPLGIIGSKDSNVIFERLLAKKEIRSMLTKRWAELRRGVWSDRAVFGMIDGYVDLIGDSYFDSDNQYRYINGAETPGTSFEDVEYIRSWLRQRLDWLDRHFANY